MIPECRRKKRALIAGGAGQDGLYLIELLLSRGYDVAAHSRHQVDSEVHGGRVCWHIGNLTDDSSFEDLMTASVPDEVFVLATVSQPATTICQIVGYQGRIAFDTTKPDGTPRKLVDVGRLHRLGWRAQIGLRDGLALVYADFLANMGC
jgi:nucleoside-diphosphate-sugar epimerase